MKKITKYYLKAVESIQYLFEWTFTLTFIYFVLNYYSELEKYINNEIGDVATNNSLASALLLFLLTLLLIIAGNFLIRKFFSIFMPYFLFDTSTAISVWNPYDNEPNKKKEYFSRSGNNVLGIQKEAEK